MIEGLDGMNPPSAAQARAAAAAGIRIWSGYLATRPDVGLARAWTRAEFENARLAGDMPLAYVSGWDDPIALKALAAAWNVRACLDDEGGIRPGGAWEQPFLDALRDDARGSGGLYGNAPVHRLRAPFHVLAAYPTSGDPSGASWWVQSPRPNTPCGWQWAGTHSFAGAGVDSTVFDDWFGGGLAGAGSAVRTATSQPRRIITLNAGDVAHQWVRGAADVNGKRALYYRQFTNGAYTPWRNLSGALNVDDLGVLEILPLSDGKAGLGVTVVGTDGLLYDYTSKDAGSSWAMAGPTGSGDGLAGLSAMPMAAAAAPVDLSDVKAGIAGIEADVAEIKGHTAHLV